MQFLAGGEVEGICKEEMVCLEVELWETLI